MRILQVLPELNVGGVETGTIDFAKWLVEKGHKSFVLSNGGGLVEKLDQGGSKHYSLPVHKKSIFSIWKMIKQVRAIIIDNKIDIVHARSRIPAWICFFACRSTKASFITTCHGYYKNVFYSQVMGKSKLVIVPSEVIGKHMINDFGVSSENIRCIPRSVDLSRFNVKKKKNTGGDVVISMVGRITPLKGHKYFLEAMASVVRSYPYAVIQIIGSAPKGKEIYQENLEILSRRLGISENIRFLGNRDDVPTLLAQTDCLVMPSIEPESFGRVVIEAQSMGVPVVASRLGGVIDIIEEGKTGLLVTPKDSKAMAKAVIRLLRSPELVDSFSKNAQEKIKNNYTLDHMALRTLEVYKELESCMHILIIKVGSIGDVILVTASIKAIHKKHPKAKIYCVVGEVSRKILLNCPYIDDLIIYKADKGWLELLSLARKVFKLKIDKIIDFQNNKKSHLLSFLSFPRESYGYSNGKWGGLLTHTVKNPRNDIGAVEHQFQILKMLDIEYQDDCYLELWPTNNDRKVVESLLDEEWLGSTKNIVGINLTASKKWETKNWPITSIAKLSDMLASKNIRVVITGMEKDRTLAQELLLHMQSRPSIVIGKTDILELAVLIKKCKVFITPDSSPMHIAAAVGTPFIAFFGPTKSSRHRPPAENFHIFERDLQCSGCYSTRCKIMTHMCMNDITPEEVFEKTIEFLEIS